MMRVSYVAEFKAESVKQVIKRGHGVMEVANRLVVSDKSLYLQVRKVIRADSHWKLKYDYENDSSLGATVPLCVENGPP